MNEQVINYKKELSNLGINDTMLIIIINAIRDNKDQLCMMNNDPTFIKVSPALKHRSKAGNKLYKILDKLGIYNILYVTIKQGYHSFRCKLSSGHVLEYEVEKNSNISFKIITALAILDFVNQSLTIKPTITNTETTFKEYATMDTKTSIQEIDYPGLGKVKINMPSGATPEAQASLNDFLSQLQSGKIKLDKHANDISVNNVSIADTYEEHAPNGYRAPTVIDSSCITVDNEK